MTETWRKVVGYCGAYEVSDLGRVRSVARYAPGNKPSIRRWIKERELRQAFSGKYFVVHLSLNGRKPNHYVHRLVAEAFIGPIAKGMTVNHINGNKLDNRLVNLEVVSHKSNIEHAIRTGLRNQRGEKNCRARLKPEDVLCIRACRLPKDEIAKLWGIKPSYVKDILNRRAWSHI